jgi:hypothetical protein
VEIYHNIYDFCKIRNHGNVLCNTHDLTPRLKFICKLLGSENISYKVDTNEIRGNITHNVIMTGHSSKMVVAHHDVSDHRLENANDNSASIINAISIKKLIPELNVVLLDGEEFGGLGSQILSNQIIKGDFGIIDYVLNLELTGIGGDNFFIGNYDGKLSNRIVELFECPKYQTPFNDSTIFEKNNIDTTVINSLPITNGSSPLIHNGKKLDTSILYNCHTDLDSVDKISTNDMTVFVEKVLYKILK